jgi:AcrR family transcriptional regulator
MRGTVTREEALDLSAMLFARHGYRATNLKLVADQLNVTRQALYYHFESKSDILAALFEKLMAKLEEATAEAALDASQEARFSAMIRAHIGVIAENTDLAAILLHERPEIARIENLNAAARRQQYMDTFVRAYEAGAKHQKLSSLDPALVVNGLLAAANAISWWYHPSGTSGLSPQRIADDTFTLLSEGFSGTELGSAPQLEASAIDY